MKFNDAITGLVVLLGGLAIILEARQFQPTHGQVYGPDLFPTIIGVGLAFSGLVLVRSGWRARHAGWVDVSALSGGRIVDALLVVLGIVGFVLFTDRLGFILVGGVIAWLLMVRFRGGAWLSSLGIAAGTVLAVDWSFRSMLLVPLPLGILPRLPW